jgi:hypothetical protein
MSLIGAFAALLMMLQNPAAIATFDGVVKSADRKYVVVAVENGEAMRMFITGKTKFIRNGKPAKATDFHEGDKVTVDAERDVRMNMLAVRVETGKPEPGKSETK